MNRSEELVESSIPVQSRISLIDLAKMDRYFFDVEGERIRTMSQLVSWTVRLMVETIEGNGKMPNVIDGVTSAYKHLDSRGLVTRGVKKRSQSRIATALRFEGLRKQGIDPAVSGAVFRGGRIPSCGDPMSYNTIHSKHSIEPLDKEVVTDVPKHQTTDEEWAEIQRKIAESRKDDREKDVQNARDMGLIVDVPDERPDYNKMTEEEFIADRQRREKELLAKENAPVEELKFDIVDK